METEEQPLQLTKTKTSKSIKFNWNFQTRALAFHNLVFSIETWQLKTASMHKKIGNYNSGMLSKLYKVGTFFSYILYWLAIFAGLKVELRPLLSTDVGFLAGTSGFGISVHSYTTENFWKWIIVDRGCKIGNLKKLNENRK